MEINKANNRILSLLQLFSSFYLLLLLSLVQGETESVHKFINTAPSSLKKQPSDLSDKFRGPVDFDTAAMDEDTSGTAQNSNGSSFEVESLQGPTDQLQLHMQQSLPLLKNEFTLTMEENLDRSEQFCLMQDMRMLCGGGSTSNLHQVWQFDPNQIPNYWDHCSSAVPGFDSVHQPQYSLDGLSTFQNPSMLGVFDPTIQNLNSSGPPPLLRELLPGPASVFGTYEGDGGLVSNRQMEEVNAADLHGNRALKLAMEIRADSVCKHKGEKPGSEKERRTHMKERFEDLRNLIPNPTKMDKASVLGDAIEYIKQLVASVETLKSLVEKKRSGMERTKRQRVDGDRSSCIKRKSKAVEVDVRIIEDEVTIKLVQRKKNNCLLLVSRVLDELHLDLHHVAGGHIGDHCSFLLNTKIYQGSSVYADAVANRLIEALDPPADIGLKDRF